MSETCQTLPVIALEQRDQPPVAAAPVCDQDDLETRFQRLRDLFLAKDAARARYMDFPRYRGPADDAEAVVRHRIEKEVLDQKWGEAIAAFETACGEFFLHRDERSVS